MIATRFNPTTNGSLHLGHLYTLMFNEQFAHSRNGKFYVRFDDDSPVVESFDAYRRENIIHQQKRDIEWLNISVDGWEYQSSMHHKVVENLKLVGHECIDDTPLGYHSLPTLVRMMGTGWLAYPYVPQQTAERVMMDHMLGISHVIRGEEFFGEFSLYRYFCEKFEFDPPEFIFLPRLSARNKDISKTNGGYTIAELRGDGYTPDDIKYIVSEAALIYPRSGWGFENLRTNPSIDL